MDAKNNAENPEEWGGIKRQYLLENSMKTSEEKKLVYESE